MNVNSLKNPHLKSVREGASDEGRRQLGEESRGLERRSGRVDGDVREDEVLLGARNRDVCESALLFDGSLMKVAIRRQESAADRVATEVRAQRQQPASASAACARSACAGLARAGGMVAWDSRARDSPYSRR